MNRRVIVGVSIFLAAVAVAGFVVLSPTESADTQERAAASAADRTAGGPAPGTAALRATINPETGEIETGVVTLGELALDHETENALRRDSEGLVEVRHPDGTVSVDLQGRFQNVSVVRITPDGKAVICTELAEGVTRLLEGGTAGAPEVK